MAKQQVMKWISVKDQLPEDQQEILTYWPERDRIQVQRFYLQYGGDGPWWMFGWDNHLLESGDITHWMPLPDPPGKDMQMAIEEQLIELMGELEPDKWYIIRPTKPIGPRGINRTGVVLFDILHALYRQMLVRIRGALQKAGIIV